MNKHEIATEVVKAAPPLAVVGTSFMGWMTWEDAAYAATTLWFLVQTAWFIGRKIWRWYFNRPIDTRAGE